MQMFLFSVLFLLVAFVGSFLVWCSKEATKYEQARAARRKALRSAVQQQRASKARADEIVWREYNSQF